MKKPTRPGYEKYSITPCPGGLKWMEGTVPTPYGNIHVYMDKKVIRIKSDGGRGVLNKPAEKGMKTMTIEPGKEQKKVIPTHPGRVSPTLSCKSRYPLITVLTSLI